MDELQLEITTDRRENMTNTTTRTTADIRQIHQQLPTGELRHHGTSDFLLLIMVKYHENDDSLLFCTSADVCCEKMAVLDHAVVSSGSGVLRQTTITTDEGVEKLIAAVMIGQGVASLRQILELGAPTATLIVNLKSQDGVTDEIIGAAAPIGIGTGTEVAVAPKIGSNLPDNQAEN